MVEEDKDVYEDIVERWSSIYKSKIGDLFTIEEVKQEAWLALLAAEDRAKEIAEDRFSFLATSIRNRLLQMFISELEHTNGRSKINSDINRVDTTTPEEVIASDELYRKLKINIKKIPNAELVFPYMNKKTVREISAIARKEGVQISRSQVQKVITSIREELNKLLLRG